jgi:hypothetical protein
MKINTSYFGVLIASIALIGCAHNSMADYASAIAKDGSFAAYDKEFAVNPQDYPAFALAGDSSRQDPEVGVYRGQSEWTTDILPSDRWEITRLVHGRFLAYSNTYGYRFCKRQLSSGGGLLNKCNLEGRMDASEYMYIYIRVDGSVYGWQQVMNNKKALFEKTLFQVKSRGDWSGQPWFKCVERCDKLVNMK